MLNCQVHTSAVEATPHYQTLQRLSREVCKIKWESGKQKFAVKRLMGEGVLVGSPINAIGNIITYRCAKYCPGQEAAHFKAIHL